MFFFVYFKAGSNTPDRVTFPVDGVEGVIILKIAEGLEMLEIPSNVMGKLSVIYPVLIWDSERAVLVDAGYPGQLAQIREAIEKAGVPFERVDTVILTHQDIDHIGSLSSIQKELQGKVKVYAHEEEKPYIQGDKCPIKLAQLESRLDSLPAEMKLVYEKLKSGFQNAKAKVDETLADGDELSCCCGIRVIHTPGHTPGHISLYLKHYKLLIAGDMLGVENGRLSLSPQSINFDNALNLKSVRKLADYDIEKVICYHGGLYGDEVSRQLKELASE